jgi:hypothetical protein
MYGTFAIGVRGSRGTTTADPARRMCRSSRVKEAETRSTFSVHDAFVRWSQGPYVGVKCVPTSYPSGSRRRTPLCRKALARSGYFWQIW